MESGLQQIMDIEMKLLRVFLTVVECESFKDAEAVLGITQSSISIAMSQLESRLGLKLCRRGRGGFQLTEAGLVAYQSTQRLFGAVEEFKAETGELRGKLQGTLRLGIVNNTITDSLSPVPIALEKFNQLANNDVQINITIASFPELQKQVHDGRLHVAIAPFRNKIPGLVYTHLYDEEHVLCCGRNHPLFDYEPRSTSLGDLRDIRLVARTSLDKNDIKSLNLKSAATTVTNIEAQTLLIRSGTYIGFLPKHYADKWIEAGELRPLLTKKIQQVLPFDMIVRKTRLKSPVVKAFIECLMDSA
jgi:DNA-binding transcriptional LysR family regulator